MRGERSKHERTVIIKNLFAADLFEKEVHLIIDYQTNLREECSKCGTVRKVIVHDVSEDYWMEWIVSNKHDILATPGGRGTGDYGRSGRGWCGRANDAQTFLWAAPAWSNVVGRKNQVQVSSTAWYQVLRKFYLPNHYFQILFLESKKPLPRRNNACRTGTSFSWPTSNARSRNGLPMIRPLPIAFRIQQ